ncbi:hypothetical protein [Bacillus thuringiensis]|uniref:hypothetical protein n=1 Tax=Bacillus thuringiensis TaxID=1428 RepID=UPI000A38A0C2|nr:hypothetical protein [Bacillus thuringiensis]OUA65053.1 hypothetical protein BK781_03555 [Bacillus thuringiensis serovar aizawai]
MYYPYYESQPYTQINRLSSLGGSGGYGGPGCVNKWTLVNVSGNIFPMLVTSYTIGGQVTGQIPTGLTNTSFPASSVTDSICL